MSDILKYNQSSLEKGADLIRSLAHTLPDTPGVYRMLDEQGNALYVGKAKSLKKRVMSYSHYTKLSLRIKRMIAQTQDMVFVHTHTETEALLLESNLIKKLAPRYNVLLRDDKSFPYILITGNHDYPLLTKHRGVQNKSGDYYGPFANGGAVNRTLNTLQKAFMLRNCSDTVFLSRHRPCLQYHINRCTAPCVGLVHKNQYKKQVEQAKAFLSGKNKEIQDMLADEMLKASKNKDYESAARYRDRIKALGSIQAHQDINIKIIGNADVFGMVSKGTRSCIMVFFFRAGQNFGNRAYFPRHSPEDTPKEIMGAFLAQFYDNKPCPREIIVSQTPAQKSLLEQALNSRIDLKSGCKVLVPKRGVRFRLIEFAIHNAKEALDREVLKIATAKELVTKLANILCLNSVPRRIEVYDNSHMSGKHMVGAMIVAGEKGFIKSAYRKFNIQNTQESDDYGMMCEVIERRFKRAMNTDSGPGSKDWPDLLIIDGGKGQLNSVTKTLKKLGLEGSVAVVSIAKGPNRNEGKEKIFMPDNKKIILPYDDPVLYYLQRLRDEAHRYAIGVHRTKRAKDITTSVLDKIPGIGPTRKRALLNYFGSARQVENAGVQDLMQVKGISKSTAQMIYNYFHMS